MHAEPSHSKLSLVSKMCVIQWIQRISACLCSLSWCLLELMRPLLYNFKWKRGAITAKLVSCASWWFLSLLRRPVEDASTSCTGLTYQLAPLQRASPLKNKRLTLPCTTWQIWSSRWRRHGRCLSPFRPPGCLSLTEFELEQVRTTCSPHTARPCWTRRKWSSWDLARKDARFFSGDRKHETAHWCRLLFCSDVCCHFMRHVVQDM